MLEIVVTPCLQDVWEEVIHITGNLAAYASSSMCRAAPYKLWQSLLCENKKIYNPTAKINATNGIPQKQHM